MPRGGLEEIVDPLYPWPIKSAIVSQSSGPRVLIWHFEDDGQPTKNEPLLSSHHEPW
jgi:hypothetical protein